MLKVLLKIQHFKLPQSLRVLTLKYLFTNKQATALGYLPAWYLVDLTSKMENCFFKIIFYICH